MKRLAFAVVLIAGLIFSLGVAGGEKGPPEEDQSDLPAGSLIPDRFIVEVSDEVTDVEEDAREFASRHGGKVKDLYRSALRGFSIILPPGTRAEELLKDKRVIRVTPDMVVAIPDGEEPRPGGRGDEGRFAPSGEVLPTGVNRIDAELYNITNTKPLRTDIDIAIIDTGTGPHADLHVVTSVNFTRESTARDLNGHGTHVGGIAAARKNGSGVIGVFPGANLHSVKVLNKKGSGFLSDVIRGVDYVGANAGVIDVANMSLGAFTLTAPASDPLCTAIKNATQKGVTFLVAAGNSNFDAGFFTPAHCPEAIAVSAIADSDGTSGGAGPATLYGLDDSFASFSNWGQAVAIASPGVNILSTYLNNGYATLSGTSMATPHVAGAAALYINSQLNLSQPRPSPGSVRDQLIKSGWAQHVTNLDGSCSSNGPPGPAFSGDPDHTHGDNGCPTAAGFDEPLVNAGAQ